MDHEIKAGQKYVAPSGCIVLVEEADTDWVRYSWEEAGVKVTRTKLPSAFLIRYPDRWIEQEDVPENTRSDDDVY
jgi:hypothetical protein